MVSLLLVSQRSTSTEGEKLSLLEMIQFKPKPTMDSHEAYTINETGQIDLERTLVVRRMDITFSEK